ncbi:galactose-binding domain-containing protein [Reichenbachiella versicolor]|uniref:galactose-binding domain-containing protein n=1 Tax=Reichenbachiella versicolor TaxID=1821036 RepID=UPI000D6E6562|nr:discoidin domain-containing protein [Reichenbachiella versicolor]
MRYPNKLLILTLILFSCQNFSKAELLSSITQHGITWHFDKEYECGQFVTGDWWVVGPVTITHTDPLQVPGRHGSVLNVIPGKFHGWDDRAGNFNENLRVKYPITLAGINSLASTISVVSKDCSDLSGKTGFMSRFGICSRTNTQTLAILTIVEEKVPNGSFRPSYIGNSQKEILNISDVDFKILPHLPILETNTDLNLLIDFIERPWLDHFNGWTTQYNFAADNNRGYGRDMSDQISEISVALMQDIPELEHLATLMIQRGIDIYQAVENGAIFPADGGHGSGRKWPILFAGKLLNHQKMLKTGYDYNASSNTFQEDCQTYYTIEGKPWWGVRHCSDPSRDSEALDSYRVCCTAKTWVGQMLTAQILGLKDEWYHEAYFDYVDRWINEGGGYGGVTDGYIQEFWNKYRNNIPEENHHSGSNEVDSEPPTSPHSLMARNVTSNSLVLSWSASSDNAAVSTYHIFMDGVLYSKVTENIRSIEVSKLDCNSTHSFQVQARDLSGNTSNMSDILTITTDSKCAPVNIALNKPVYATDEEIPTPATHAVDGNIEQSSRWSAKEFPQTIEIDLGANYELSNIEIFTYKNRAYQYTVEGKIENGNYTLLADRRTNTSFKQPISNSIDGIARYVKITVTGSFQYRGSWVSLTEIKIYGDFIKNASSKLLNVATQNTVSVNLYPNPVSAKDYLTIESKDFDFSQSTYFFINDFSGKTIYETANISNLRPFKVKEIEKGIYVVSISNGKQFFKTKLIVK